MILENLCTHLYRFSLTAPLIIYYECVWIDESCQLILLFGLFLLLFMGPIVLFDTIYEFHCIISANFYLHL